MYFSFRPSSTHREPEVTVNNRLSLDYMHPDDHIPITCNNYPKCKKEYKRNKTNTLHALLQKKKKINWLHTTYSVISYQQKLCYKRESMYPLITYTLFYCIDSPPLAWQNCNVEACPSQYKWHVGDWGKCSKTCGEELKRRTKKCAGKDMISTSWKLCKGHEPVTKMK